LNLIGADNLGFESITIWIAPGRIRKNKKKLFAGRRKGRPEWKKKKEQDKSDKQKSLSRGNVTLLLLDAGYWRVGCSTKADRDFLAVLVSIVCLYSRRGYWILQWVRMNHMAGDFDDCKKKKKK
jgi:hypothetical protein